MDDSAEITRLLRNWQDGDAEALNRLMPLVYAELRTLAARHLSRERRGHTLQPTALVNEACVRLIGGQAIDWHSRAHFFAIAARVMRHILVDRARHAGRLKRGGELTQLALEEADPAAPSDHLHPVDALSLDRALSRLEALDPQQGRIVELRFFGGLTIQETADVMRLSSGTVKRGWVVA